jgi:phenylpropionate dioxygenase-like ring-hydroxylating dioxygenase large terminal subunit
MKCELKSEVKAALLALRPTSDIRRGIKWADNCPPYLQVLPDEIPDYVPYKGLRNYWYPVMPVKKLGSNQMVPSRLLGEDLIFFRSADGNAQAINDVCPHRQARLSLGFFGLYAPGTVTCAYHGWTFDGSGQCVAALAEGPDSPIPRKVRTRSYPVEERHYLIWVYMGDPKYVPDLDENIPHAKEAMAGTWSWFLHWDWPVNYLNALDNDADPLHPSLLHATCVHTLDQKRWDHPFAEDLSCGGLMVGLKGMGPPHRGVRSANEWDMHVPGYIHFPPHPPQFPNPVIFWAIPIDKGNMRMFNFTSFRGPLWLRVKNRLQMFHYWEKWGAPNNVYWCNLGQDRAIVMSQGRLADRRLEHLARSDLPIIRFRKMMEQAYAAERAQATQYGDNTGQTLKHTGPEAVMDNDHYSLTIL